jgi:redox-sensitive bicupin YhaK (pirin superfamily)
VSKIILETRPLGFPWETADPFLFCVHHDDAYPSGNEQLGPAASLRGRNLGQDFAGKDGWRMYHGRVVPGFPQHPHRGFETVTIVRRGLIDHSDSLGAAARFGRGDTQWLTAGGGIVHSEMFPLLDPSGPNPVELFQIWLNLPGEDKMAAPHFAMLWSGDIPRCAFVDDAGRTTQVAVIAGQLDGKRAPPPPPRSWAARPESDVAIWTVQMAAGAKWTVPPAASEKSVRTLYFFGGSRAGSTGARAVSRFPGSSLRVAGETISLGTAVVVRSDVQVPLEAGSDACEILLLQGRPIGQPVAQYGPFVMNTKAEVQQAIRDYQRTQFGGWPWPADDPVHAKEEGRFAKHADGRVERIEEPPR